MDITLVPTPQAALQQTNSIGYGTVKLTTLNGTKVSFGDVYVLELSGMVPGLANIGYTMPWDPNTIYYGGVIDSTGHLLLYNKCNVAGDHQITDGQGIILAAGVYGSAPNTVGFPSPFPGGYRACQWSPQGPAPAPAPPGIGKVEANIDASWTSHTPYADWRTDSVVIPYQSWPAYSLVPIATAIPPIYALSDAVAAKIAADFGGRVVKAPPAPYFKDSSAVTNGQITGVVPDVNWIYVAIDGVPSKALGMVLVAAFDNRESGLAAAILASFIPA